MEKDEAGKGKGTHGSAAPASKEEVKETPRQGVHVGRSCQGVRVEGGGEGTLTWPAARG